MKIAVLSGKGGTGKTFVSANLAACAGKATYLDCDVEAPNGHLFFRPAIISAREVFRLLPSFDAKKCTACRACVDFCKFNALALINGSVRLFPEVCHACGGCNLICKQNAVCEKPHPVGEIQIGAHNRVNVVTGILNLGEASGIPVIKSVLAEAGADEVPTLIDCPPGSACAVMESVRAADYCILVAEPTAFGLHNFKMVHELVSLLRKPCGVIINKAEEDDSAIDAFCRQRGIVVLCRIPYSEKLASLGATAQLACECDEESADLFKGIWKRIYAEAAV